MLVLLRSIAVARVQHYSRGTRCGRLPLILNNNYGWQETEGAIEIISIYSRYGTISHEAAISARSRLHVDVVLILTIKSRSSFHVNLGSDTLPPETMVQFGRTPESTNVLRYS
ncbi:hypothetical protein F5887DRAFT_914865 [Amanita rubescens]|nr:hypothetical protein F5887DRAFT_914865 [Amanita rubescens]